MNKPRSKRMQRVADIAGYATDQAAHVMAHRIREIDLAQHQLRELEQFRRDYTRSDTPDGAATRCANDLLNHQRFMLRIDAAISQQREDVERKLQDLAAARAAWDESRVRSAALKTVSERYRTREAAIEQRNEQTIADERAQRQGPRWGHPDRATR